MIWLIIERRMSKPMQGGHKIELPGLLHANYEIEAPDRTEALRIARRLHLQGRVEVVAEVSWRLMSEAERDRRLGNFTPPDETKEAKALRRSATREQGGTAA